MADVTRRAALAGLVATAAAPAPTLAWDFQFPSIDEGTLDLADLRGRVLLVVNTASYCGFTPQYKQLEAVHRRLSPRGFAVVGVPSQDFGQEKGSNTEVKAFCEATFDIDFPMAGLSRVRGRGAAPFYAWVKAERGWEPGWNFAKVLVGRNGRIAGTYDSNTLPDARPLSADIEAALSGA